MFRNFVATMAVLAMASCGVDSNPEFDSEIDTATDDLTSSRVSDWFPVADGNQWVLRSAKGVTRTVNISDPPGSIASIDGMVHEVQWASVSNLAPNTLLTWSTENGGRWLPFLRFGYAVTSWTWGSGPCSTFTVRRSGTGRKVVTEAGTFTDTRSIAFTLKPSPTARCVAPMFSEFTFAAGVGLVQVKTPAGEVFNLASAKVGKRTWPQGNGLSAKLKSDKVSYVSKPNSIRCITTPCPSNEEPAIAKLTYTVTNSTAASATWHFSNSCQTNTQVFDSNGSVVKDLQILRDCLQALSSFTLAPGQSKVFTDEVTLTSDVGEMLEGTYTAKMYLVPSNTSPALGATTRFSVSLKP